VAEWSAFETEVGVRDKSKSGVRAGNKVVSWIHPLRCNSASK